MPARATLAKRRADVAAMFDQVAARYDLLNSLTTLGAESKWREYVVAAVDPRPGQLILDLAAGTGASSRPLADRGATVIPTDLSLGMLSVGKQREPDLQFLAGDALGLPFATGSFDAVTISFGLRNVEDTSTALHELRRVTKPGGRLVICEFSTPTWAPFRAAYHAYLRTAIPALAAVSSNPAAYSYLADSILSWPAQRPLADLMAAAGWQRVQWQNVSQGIVAIHRGWA